MPRKRAASSFFFTLYTMFSPDEKWVLMHIAAAGGEKIAWLPIKAAWHWKQEKCMDFLLRVLYGIETSFMFFGFFLVEKE